MYGSLEDYTEWTDGTVENYKMAERQAIRALKTICPGFPTVEELAALGTEIQGQVMSVVYDLIYYQDLNDYNATGITSERIGSYSYNRASGKEVRAIPDDLAQELLSLGICKVGQYADCFT